MKNKNREILIDLQENFEEYMQSIAEDNKYNLVGDDFIDYQLNKYGTIGTEGSAYVKRKKVYSMFGRGTSSTRRRYFKV